MDAVNGTDIEITSENVLHLSEPQPKADDTMMLGGFLPPRGGMGVRHDVSRG
jgi:hypothetical protein